MDTVGSAIDTVLAAYSGSSLSALTRLAQDNDSASQPGSFGASRVAFVVNSGTISLPRALTSYGSGRIAINYMVITVPAITARPE